MYDSGEFFPGWISYHRFDYEEVVLVGHQMSLLATDGEGIARVASGENCDRDMLILWIAYMDLRTGWYATRQDPYGWNYKCFGDTLENVIEHYGGDAKTVENLTSLKVAFRRPENAPEGPALSFLFPRRLTFTPKYRVPKDPAKVDNALRYAVLTRDGCRCVLCGSTVDDGTRLEVDHIHPASKGGVAHIDNLRTLCFECNRGKSDTVGGA